MSLFNFRPYKCEQCDKAFYKPSDLKKHVDVHKGNKSFLNLVNSKFYYSNMTYFVLIFPLLISDVRNFPCTSCSMQFRDKSNLKRHMLTHTNEKPFCCSGCGNRFKQVRNILNLYISV